MFIEMVVSAISKLGFVWCMGILAEFLVSFGISLCTLYSFDYEVVPFISSLLICGGIAVALNLIIWGIAKSESGE